MRVNRGSGARVPEPFCCSRFVTALVHRCGGAMSRCAPGASSGAIVSASGSRRARSASTQRRSMGLPPAIRRRATGALCAAAHPARTSPRLIDASSSQACREWVHQHDASKQRAGPRRRAT